MVMIKRIEGREIRNEEVCDRGGSGTFPARNVGLVDNFRVSARYLDVDYRAERSAVAGPNLGPLQIILI